MELLNADFGSLGLGWVESLHFEQVLRSADAVGSQT
jgi:hypothetical protein